MGVDYDAWKLMVMMVVDFNGQWFFQESNYDTSSEVFHSQSPVGRTTERYRSIVHCLVMYELCNCSLH